MSKPNDFPPEDQTFVSHLIELRDRLLRAVLAVLVIFLCLFAFANDIYAFVAEPLMRHMPAGTSMIATEVASPFLTPFKLTLVMSVFAAMPVILYQLWAFVAPGLYQNERKLVLPLLVSSTFLFYLGMAFAYYVVFPLVFRFLTGVVPEGVAVMTDISRYLDFVLKMFFAFGVAFEVPIATILVIWTGLTTAESLASKRPYIIVAAFVIGMLLTPPDVISQTLLALPMWALFELGLILSKIYVNPSKEEDAKEDNEVEASEPSDASSAAAKSSVTAATVGAATATATATKAEVTVTEDGESVAGDEYRPLDEAEMEAELDRIESEEQEEEGVSRQTAHGADVDNEVLYDNQDNEIHEEFEPISEEEARKLDNAQDNISSQNDTPKE